MAIFRSKVNPKQDIEDAFNTSSGHDHDGTNSKRTAYDTVIAGISSQDAGTTTSIAISAANVGATDAALAQCISTSTAGYVTQCAVAAGVGLIVRFSAAVGLATVSYCVFKAS